MDNTLPVLVDTHCHVNFEAYTDDDRTVIDRALNSGVRMINVGTNYKTSKKAVHIESKNYPKSPSILFP